MIGAPTNLDVTEAILRAAGRALTVREIVERAGDTLPTAAKNRGAVVARDLSRDIVRPGSRFVRVAPGMFTLRELAPGAENSPPRVPTRAGWHWTPEALARRRERYEATATAKALAGTVARACGVCGYRPCTCAF